MFARYTVVLHAPDESDEKFSENEEVTEVFEDQLGEILDAFRSQYPGWRVELTDS